MTEIKEAKLEEACCILFGDQFSIEQATIDYLQLSGIKHAYRNRVKECHPDVSASKDISNDNFIKLKNAYDFLISIKSEKGTQKIVDKETTSHLPERKLKLGEYLYYTGKVSWDELISAITWQKHNSRNNNLLFGMYFVKFGILSTSELGFAVFKQKIHNANY